MNPQQKNFWHMMLILFFVVLIIFSIVKTKIVHYSSLTYFPLTFVAAWGVKEIVHLKNWKFVSRILFAFLSIFWLIVLAGIPILASHIDFIKIFIHDQFTQGNFNASVKWSWVDFIPAVLLLISVLSFTLIFDLKKSFAVLFIGNIFVVQSCMVLFVPKIEKYSQGAEISFYKSIAGKNCYVFPYNFKSYAHLFYTQRLADYPEKAKSMQWLLTGPIDKVSFFVCRKGIEPIDYTDVKKFAEENGFVFYYRLPVR